MKYLSLQGDKKKKNRHSSQQRQEAKHLRPRINIFLDRRTCIGPLLISSAHFISGYYTNYCSISTISYYNILHFFHPNSISLKVIRIFILYGGNFSTKIEMICPKYTICFDYFLDYNSSCTHSHLLKRKALCKTFIVHIGNMDKRSSLIY